MLLKEWNLEEAQKVWLKDGIRQGMRENARQNARNMKAEGLDLHLIARITGLTFDEVLNA